MPRLLKTIIVILLVSSVVAGEQKCKMEFDDSVVITDDQIDIIRNMAVEDFNGVMEKIYFGRIGAHGGRFGSRVHFENEIVDSYAIERHVVIIFECETTNTQNGVMRVVADKEFKSWGLWTKVKRVFELSKDTIHLQVPQELSYATVDRLLKSIDKRTYEIKGYDEGNTRSLRSFSGMHDVIDMTQIISINYDKEKGLIVVRTSRRLGAGSVYRFKVTDDTITLVSGGTWYA